MTPSELATIVFRELSPLAPRLAAAINRALLDIGEGSRLVGLGPGRHVDDPVSFTESETIRLDGRDAADVLSRITQVVWQLEEHSRWQVFIDRKTASVPGILELYYTLFRPVIDAGARQ
jgi:hypothetical protein